MKVQLFVILSVVIAVRAAWIRPQEEVRLLSYESEQTDLNGANKFSFKQSDGQERGEEIFLKVLPNGAVIPVFRGFYSYIGDDGRVYTVHYIADEKGYQPIGDHIPQQERFNSRT